MTITKDILEKLCRINGRALEVSNNRKYKVVTFDKYDGCDCQYFQSFESAYDWECGYALAHGNVHDEKDIPSPL